VPSRRISQELALGFCYWLVFLIILQPGNIFQAARANVPLPFFQEVLRIGGAGLLGATVTPILLDLTRRFPVEGSRRWRHAIIHAISIVCLSLVLIGIAQLLAGWFLTGRDPRLQAPLDRQLVANAPLLILCMAAFVASAHAVTFWRRAEQGRAQSQPVPPPIATAPRQYPTIVTVKNRGRTLLVPVAEITWVETQGNYLALHTPSATHLIRETLTQFENRVDPEQFARIHRTTLVAIACVQEITALSNGDASLRLIDGTTLRLSRNYRSSAAALLSDFGNR
jgi:hypothetical protein